MNDPVVVNKQYAMVAQVDDVHLLVKLARAQMGSHAVLLNVAKDIFHLRELGILPKRKGATQ